jgi:hypothetical protein
MIFSAALVAIHGLNMMVTKRVLPSEHLEKELQNENVEMTPFSGRKDSHAPAWCESNRVPRAVPPSSRLGNLCQ